MQLVFTVQEKHRQLRMRRDEQRKLGQHIDQIVRQAEAEEGEQPAGAGCASGLCGMLNRWRGRRGTSVRTAEMSAAPSAADRNVAIHRAVFGLAGIKKGDPAAKLEEAAAVMRSRVVSLEQRAAEQRAEAKRLAQAGQKAQALRMLKKAKAVEAQVEANQQSLMAVEQQVDMLAQAAMQKTLSSALASTSKTMKRDAKALSKAEDAIDDAAEARDMATDLSQVMAEFAQNGHAEVDEDELEAELEAMVGEEPTPPPLSPVSAEETRRQQIAALEAKIAQRQAQTEIDAAEAKALRDSFPVAPNGTVSASKKEEKSRLLEPVAQS